jgi:hypothetical protein
MCLKSWGLIIEEEKEAKAIGIRGNIEEEVRFTILELYINIYTILI